MVKPKYNIIFETRPSNKYKTKEEADMIIDKATNLLIQELIINRIK